MCFILHKECISSVQSLSCIWLFVTPWTAAHQASLSVTKLQELFQTLVHWVSDAIQLSHPLSSPLPPSLNPSQHQGLFQWVGSSHQVAKVLELQLQHQSFQWIFSVDFPQDWLVWSLCCPRGPQESSPAPQFKSSVLQCSAFFMSNFLMHTWLWKNHRFD